LRQAGHTTRRAVVERFNANALSCGEPRRAPRSSTIRFSLVLIAAIAATGCSQATEQDTRATDSAQTATLGVPAVGEYQLDADNRSATLAVKAATTSAITFDLEVFNNSGGYNQGFVTDATARGSNGVYKHTSEDCELTFRVSADSIEVAQQGVCGMGTNHAPLRN
jgi:hypothetical protein